MKSLIFSLLLFGAGAAATAQVSVTNQVSADKSSTLTTVGVSTMDHSFVPLIVQSKRTKVDPDTSRTDSVVKARRNDGTYFDWQQQSAVTRQINPTVAETTTEVTERDREGGVRATRRMQETLTKSDGSETVKADEYKRDASGQLVLDREITATTTKNGDGTSRGVRTEKTRDVSGRLVVAREIEETVVPTSATDKQVTRNIKSVSHLDGEVRLTGRELSTVRTDGNTLRTEAVSEVLGDGGWRVVGKTTTTETRAADGTIQRETTEQGQSLYDKFTSFPTEPLVPQRRVVEREVRQADGTTVLQRDAYRRDVNGDWKPVTFSLDGAAAPGK